MKISRCQLTAVLFMVLCSVSGGSSASTEYCKSAGEFKPIRQTVIFVDEFIVKRQEGPDVPLENIALNKLVLGLAKPSSAEASQLFIPRERLSVFVVPRDGSGPKLVFSGCEPFYSPEELEILEKNQSTLSGLVSTFFGSDPKAQARENAKNFERDLAVAIVTLGKSETSGLKRRPSKKLEDSNIVSSLLGAPRLIDRNNGVPRIILVSDFAFLRDIRLKENESARGYGFELAKQVDLDFGGAELYLMDLSKDRSTRQVRELGYGFFLGSGAWVEAWSNSSMGRVQTAPVDGVLFKGRVDYGGEQQPPMHVRLAWDDNGLLINSWVFLTLSGRVATPLHGNILCDGEQSCRVSSGDSGFAQVWSRDPDKDAEYDGDTPFGGLRYFELEFNGDIAKGRVWDPEVAIIGKRKDLKFELKRVENSVFELRGD